MNTLNKLALGLSHDQQVLPGADWQIMRRDGVLEIDARYALREAGGGIVQVLLAAHELF